MTSPARTRAVALAAAALAVTVISGCGTDDTRVADSPTRDRTPSKTPPTSESAASSNPSESASAVATSELTVPAYYLGDGPRGTRLFREFDRIEAADALAGALVALQSAPADPDYSTPWPDGAFADASFDGTGDDGLIQVTLADASLHDRPAGMSQDDAELAIQQVVYTTQAATQTRAAVQFVLDGNPVDQVYGVPTAEPLANAPQTEVLSLMSITSPAEGASVSGSFTAHGVGSSFEANVPWEIRDGDEVVKSGFTTAEGWMDKLYPWETEAIDVSDLAPGDYTFVAMTDDASGGEGGGPDVDTRTITVG